MKITLSQENADYEHKIEQLRKLQLAEFDILKKVAKTFEENGICYYLGYGTLLGAIRHKGFIPWDDDVDVFLPRPDFEKFRKIADDVLKKPLFLNKDIMPRPICLQQCMRIENSSEKKIMPKGTSTVELNVSIDIFPIDGAPESSFKRTLLFVRAKMLEELLRFPRAYEDGVDDLDHRPLIKVLSWFNNAFKIGKHISAIKLAQRFDAMRRKYSYDDNEWSAAWTLDYKTRIFCKKEWFGTGRKELFEDTYLSVPQNSEAVLKQYYGDYMTPPPEDERVLKHVAGLATDDDCNGAE